MMFGSRHSDKCTDAERKQFLKKVKNFLNSKKFKYNSIKSFTSFGGFVRIYTGGMSERARLRKGRKVVAYRDEQGVAHGDNPEAIGALKERDASASELWQITTQPIIELEHFDVYRVDPWEEEKEYLTNWFKEEVN